MSNAGHTGEPELTRRQRSAAMKLDERLNEAIHKGDVSEFEVLIELKPEKRISPEASDQEMRRQFGAAARRLEPVIGALRDWGVARIVPLELVDALSTTLSLSHIRRIAEMDEVERLVLMEPQQVLLLHQTAAHVGARTAEAAGLTGAGVIVAVFDNGIDASHPALQGRVVKSFAPSQLCSSPQGETAFGVQTGSGHGTHVAGIVGSHDHEYRGIAPECQLWDVKVADSEGLGRVDWLLEGMQWTIKQVIGDWSLPSPPEDRRAGPRPPNTQGGNLLHSSCEASRRRSRLGCMVANISMGLSSFRGHRCPVQGNPCEVCRGAETMVHVGITVVVATGNDGERPETRNQVNCPGNAAPVITVAASTIEGAGSIAPFSSRGPGISGEAKPNVCAPGGCLSGHVQSCKTGGNWTAMEGTSMAAPHVAGACALMLQEHPRLTPADVKRALMDTAKPLPNETGISQGRGLLDIPAALGMATQIWEENAPMANAVRIRALVDNFLLNVVGVDPDDFWTDPSNYLPGGSDTRVTARSIALHLRVLEQLLPQGLWRGGPRIWLRGMSNRTLGSVVHWPDIAEELRPAVQHFLSALVNASLDGRVPEELARVAQELRADDPSTYVELMDMAAALALADGQEAVAAGHLAKRLAGTPAGPIYVTVWAAVRGVKELGTIVAAFRESEHFDRALLLRRTMDELRVVSSMGD